MARLLPIALSLTVAVLATTGLTEAQTRTHGLSEFRTFELEYIDDTGASVTVDQDDAYISYPFMYLTDTVFLWQIKIPGSGAPLKDVWVGIFVNAFTQTYSMGFFHPSGLPDDWRVRHLKQTFGIAFEEGGSLPALDLAEELIMLPVVYGPTHFACDAVQSKDELYPTFLQTQQMTIFDLISGGALTMYTDDDGGHRKRMGLSTDGTKTGVKFTFSYIPDQFEYGTGYDLPKYAEAPYLWISKFDQSFSVRFKNELDDQYAAIDHYRAQQLDRPASWLSERTPSSTAIHPYMRDAKFAVGVGASLSTVTVAHQFDMSGAYRTGVLSAFTSLHGDDLMIYHLGWAKETSSIATILPDTYQTMLPGHTAMVTEAHGLGKGVKAAAYHLPAIMSTTSSYYSSSNVLIEEDGGLAVSSLVEYPAGDFRLLSWYPSGVTSIYSSLAANDLLDTHKFDGIYFDALSPAPSSYAFHQHGHLDGVNEQFVGINALMTDTRAIASSLSLPKPILFNETPCDCMPTDASGIDFNAVLANSFSVFKMTYSGEEHPGFAAIFAWDIANNKPDGVGYVLQLAHCLAAGVRPLILWPEINAGGTPLFPVDPNTDPNFAEFVTMLKSYCADYDTYWEDIMLGRARRPIDPDDVLISLIPELGADGPNPLTRWRMPGIQPVKNSTETTQHPLAQIPVPAILHGVCVPKGSNRPCVTMIRWTDPSMAGPTRRNVPLSNPLHNTNETITFRITARDVGGRPGDLIKLGVPGQPGTVVIGRLPLQPGQRVQIPVLFTGVGAKTLTFE